MRIRNRGGASCPSQPQPQPHHHHHHHGRSPLAVLPSGSHADRDRAVDISAVRSNGDRWRKALLGTKSREFDVRGEMERAGEAGECSNWNGSTRKQGQDSGIASKKAIKNEEFAPKEATSNTSSEEGNDDDMDSDRMAKSRRLAENSFRYENSVVQYHVKGKYSPMFAMPSKKRRRTKQAPICSHDKKLLGDKTILKDERHCPVKVAGKDVKSQETNGITELSADKCTMHAGSRCRRMNGRGWRCSQRTLVGYALCEHHLGKGRLKSINSNASALDDGAKATQVEDSQFGLSHPADDNYDKHHAKKRIVKARSLKLISL